jgi:DNA repair photolyase
MQKKFHKGRGAQSNDSSRFVDHRKVSFDDGWHTNREDADSVVPTEVYVDQSKSILTRNNSPDIPFNLSINPYKGCEHGCAYCYARPTHAYLDLSPGLDFETKIFAKPNAALLLRKAFDKSRYKPEVIALGANTDPYQPIERKLQITRQLLEVMRAYQHPVAIITKSALIERDIDILADMAQRHLVQVAVSVTTLDHELSRRLEPRAASPKRRLQTISRLTEAGIPVNVLFAPVIPMLNDNELEDLLSASRDAGMQSAAYVMLRLPHEVKDLFQQWLQTHYPLKAKHIMNIIRDMRGGKDYDAQFGVRQTGQGAYADLFAQRFALMRKKINIDRPGVSLDVSLFKRPVTESAQLEMF